MQTTIADFVISNPANIDAENLGSSDPTLARQAFQSRITYDGIIEDASPTLVYVKNNEAIAWFETNSLKGYSRR